MFLLRTSRTATAARVVAAPATSRAPFTTSSFRFASGDYGSGAHKHGKKLEKESHDKEHPGPPPPSTGGKSKSSESSQPSSSSSGQSQSNDGAAAQPKILNDARPAEGEESEEVRKHNEEFCKRADRQQDGKKDDKVDKEFWKGQGGVDREP
ncbi:hypothetical protein CKM354_000075700 [Cercospora kikuchii]|uniref:Uncharacterized protein n=1 Tax=Cercospora kikuchii TaxID=84275 RepID=A0A9P3FBA4_9PEZI|nr:uncharacterized protein CKM354_000075700 [Cercospora kikuchii]GIZ37307.1 hypothetical protein CKM354_000075700 [Cercospora kikuchii]